MVFNHDAVIATDAGLGTRSVPDSAEEGLGQGSQAEGLSFLGR